MILASTIRQEKEIKDIKNERVIKVSLFTNYTIVETNKNTLGLKRG